MNTFTSIQSSTDEHRKAHYLNDDAELNILGLNANKSNKLPCGIPRFYRATNKRKHNYTNTMIYFLYKSVQNTLSLSTWQDIYNTLVLSTDGISDHYKQQAISFS